MKVVLSMVSEFESHDQIDREKEREMQERAYSNLAPLMYVVSTFLLDIYASENRALWIYFSWQAAMPASVSVIGTFPSSRYVNKPTGI